MRNNTKTKLQSPLSGLIEKFITEKQACGYRYQRECYELLRLDRFLCKIGLQTPRLTRDIVDKWTAKQIHEKPSNQRLRIIRFRQFALYLHRQGFDAYIPETIKVSVRQREFIPFIYSHRQVKNILLAVDSTQPDNCSPMRHLIMPEVFRLLYCCGMRVSEVLHLKSSDVDLAAGILTVRTGKFNKDRLIPLSSSIEHV